MAITLEELIRIEKEVPPAPWSIDLGGGIKDAEGNKILKSLTATYNLQVYVANLRNISTSLFSKLEEQEKRIKELELELSKLKT